MGGHGDEARGSFEAAVRTCVNLGTDDPENGVIFEAAVGWHRALVGPSFGRSIKLFLGHCYRNHTSRQQQPVPKFEDDASWSEVTEEVRVSQVCPLPRRSLFFTTHALRRTSSHVFLLLEKSTKCPDCCHQSCGHQPQSEP